MDRQTDRQTELRRLRRVTAVAAAVARKNLHEWKKVGLCYCYNSN